MRAAFKEENMRRMIRRSGITAHGHGKSDLISQCRVIADHLTFNLLLRCISIATLANRRTVTEEDVQSALKRAGAGRMTCPGNDPLAPCRAYRQRGRARTAEAEVNHEVKHGNDCFYLPVKSLAAYLKHVLKEVVEEGPGKHGPEFHLTKSARNCIQLTLETFLLQLLWRARDVVARVHTLSLIHI